MYMKLDEEVEHLLCCSLCKGEVERYTDGFACKSCGLRFPGRTSQRRRGGQGVGVRFSHPPP